MATFSYILSWWIVLFILGLSSYPLIIKLFPSSPSRGYVFSKLFSLLTVSYAVFILSLLRIARYSYSTVVIVLVILFLISLYLSLRDKSFFTNIKRSLPFIAIEELLFTGGLIYWSLIRGFQPDIIGLEKFMDVGFINSLLRTEYLPPIDMWFSGQYINYYWFGHYMTSLLTVLSRIPSTITYNLMLATILGFSLAGAFSIVSNLLSRIKPHSYKTIIVGGLLSAALITFAGNFHTTFFTLRQKACENNLIQCTSKALQAYWYPDATRFIGYDPETQDKTIHEFPLYSFVVSDLHAHLINLPFVLLFIAFLANLVFEIKYSKNYYLVIIGFLIGCFFMTNAWDTANYLLLTGITLGFTELFKYKNNSISTLVFQTIKNTVISLLVIGSTAYVTAYPFISNFVSIAQGSDFVNARTPFWQLVVLWGMPFILTIIFTLIIYKRFKSETLEVSDIFVGCLLITSIALIVLPEIIYVKDIYIASHHRANTMFKLTYQAFVMSYLTGGYVAIRALQSTKSTFTKIAVLLFLGCVFSAVLQYPRYAINSYYGELKEYRGLSGDAWLNERYPNEKAVIDWFNSTVKGQPTILEASGDSYTDFNVVSAYTGLPTVNGWFVHEWLWRGNPQSPQARVNDISTIYTSSDRNLVAALVSKYTIEYIIVGTLERQKYPTINEPMLASLGELVFSSGSTNVYQID